MKIKQKNLSNHNFSLTLELVKLELSLETTSVNTVKEKIFLLIRDIVILFAVINLGS